MADNDLAQAIQTDPLEGIVPIYKRQSEKAAEQRGRQEKAAQAELLSQEGKYTQPAPDFKPTQESMSGFAAMGSLLAAAGAILGSNGRSSGLMAMNAVSGMMNGYNAGRKDLYEQQRQQFEESMKSWEKHREQVKDLFAQAAKLAPYNLSKAQQYLNDGLKSLGMQPLAEVNQRSGPIAAMSTFNRADQNMTSVLAKAQVQTSGLLNSVPPEQRGMFEQMLNSKDPKDVLAALEGLQAMKKTQAAARTSSLAELKTIAEIENLQRQATKSTEIRKDFLNKKTGELEYMTTAEANKNPNLIEVSPTYAQAIAGQKAADDRARAQREAQQKRTEYVTEAAAKRQQRAIEAAKDRTAAYVKARNTATPDDIEANAHMIANNVMKLSSIPAPTREAVAARAKQINPAWSEADFGNQSIAYRNWVQPNGFGAKQISAFSTVAQHIDLMEELAAALDNNDQPAVNSAINFFRTQLGHPEVNNFNTARQAVASELVRAYSGTAGALDDRKTADDLLTPNLSPDQIQGVLDTAKELVGARLYTAKSMYESGTGRSDFENILPGSVKRMFGDYIKDKGVVVNPSGKSAEQRFNELIDQGVSENDAYQTLAKEGYK